MNNAAAQFAPDQSSRRETHALFLHAVMEFLAARRLTDPVKKRVPEHTRRTLERPPLADRWIPAHAVEDVFEALHDLGGPPLNLQLGKFAASRMTEGRLRPLIAGIFSLRGKSPESIFKSLDVCYSLAMRGVSFTYQGSRRAALVVASFAGGNVHEGAHHAVRGALLHAFELTQAHGEVDPPELIADDGAAVRIRYAVRF